MRYPGFLTFAPGSSHFVRRTGLRLIVPATWVILSAFLITACSSTPGASTTADPTPTIQAKVVVTPNSQPTPTKTATPKPTPATSTPTPVVQSTPVQQGAPAILDLRPTSMSLVGHLDCQKNGAYICFARVLSRADAQSDLNWSASTDVPGGVSFSPASGVLKPGQSVLITITVPLNACTPGLFSFQGPINTHTITWAC